MNQVFILVISVTLLYISYSLSTAELTKHLKSHADKKVHTKGKFSCSTCSQTFNRRQALKDHEMTHLDATELPEGYKLVSVIDGEKEITLQVPTDVSIYV